MSKELCECQLGLDGMRIVEPVCICEEGSEDTYDMEDEEDLT